MNTKRCCRTTRLRTAQRGAMGLFCLLTVSYRALADGVTPYAGLWVGTVALGRVNEVTIAKDANNVDVAPDPAVPTVTADRADILLILHVNGAGQASLLKDVAVMNRNVSGLPGASVADAVAARSDESSLSLVTDPGLYAEFPAQKAIHLSSVVFDFGDAQATAAVDALVAGVVAQAVAFVQGVTPGQIDTAAERNAQVNAQGPVIAADQASCVDSADVAAGFSAFLNTFTPSIVQAVASAPDGADAQQMTAAAQALRDVSFYGDTRALEMVEAVKAAGAVAALNVAARFADTANLYQRYVCGKLFGDTVWAAAACVSTNAVLTVQDLKGGVASAAASEALRIQALSSPYADTRAMDALDAVLEAVIEAAQAASGQTQAERERLAAEAGKAALAQRVARYPLPLTAPTRDYTAFVTSPSFAGAPLVAARAALAAGLLEKADNPLTWPVRVPAVARDAAVNALQAVYAAAALAVRHDVPLAGTFGPGSGDPRYTAEVQPPDGLGPAGLAGTIRLPANHPTHPFRHRRHPDHSTGIDLTRLIRIDFDGEASTHGGMPVAYGVASVTGVYREEIFGLHKPLGANKDIGLKVEGRFQLNRVSRIDTLNAQ